MKNNPLLEKRYNADITHNVEMNYLYSDNRQVSADMLSEFYDFIAKYYDLVDMRPGKEFLINSFINDNTTNT